MSKGPKGPAMPSPDEGPEARSEEGRGNRAQRGIRDKAPVPLAAARHRIRREGTLVRSRRRRQHRCVSRRKRRVSGLAPSAAFQRQDDDRPPFSICKDARP